MAEMKLPDIIEVVKFPSSVETNREVRLVEGRGYVMLIRDKSGNEIYDFYDDKGLLRKQEPKLKDPTSVEKIYMERPNMASLEFCLSLIKAIEGYRAKYNQMLDMLTLQAEELRKSNNK